jgi:pectinesterase inhibitor-like protein
MPLVLAMFLLAVAATWQQPAASALPPAPAPGPVPGGLGDAAGAEQAAAVEFVRGCCARTLYPRLCCAALAPYAASVHSSHARLALASANLTLATLEALAARIPRPGSGGGDGGALRDCAELVASAADQAARAAERLRGIERAVGLEVTWRVDDARTWLSAAMTDEDTCADGLRPRKSAPAPVRAELRASVRRAKQYTSIALALVNMLVSNH